MKKLLISILIISSSLFALNFEYTKAFFLYQKGFKTLNNNPILSKEYFKKSFKILKKLEEKNLPSSQTYYLLGIMYANGWGTKQNYSKAEKELLKAMKLGNIKAKCQLAFLYQKMNKLEEAKKYITPECKNLVKEIQ